MIPFSTLITTVLMFALLILPGFVLGKCKLIERASLVSMTNILMYVAMPFLVFSKLIVVDLDKISPIEILLCTMIPAVVILAGFGIAAPIFRKKDRDTRWRVARFCAIMPNCGFLGIPLADALFEGQPEVGAAVTIYMSLFNMVSTFLLLTFGVYILSGDKRDISLRRAVFSPIMIAIVLGVIILLLGIVSEESLLYKYADILATLTKPLPMLILGVELSRIRFRAFFTTPALYLTAALKLVAMPLATIGILFLLKLCGLPLSAPLMVALFLSSAVSTAASAPAMSKKYDCDGEFAAILTLGTTILCVATLPLTYKLASLVLGL